MPELPEVETVRQGLLPIMKERKILKLDQRREDLRWPLPKNLPSRVKNFKISNILRRSKYLLINLNSAETIIIHLGMSGRLLVLKDLDDTTTGIGNFNYKTHNIDKHDHIIIYLDSGVRIVYNDPRRFGAIDLVSTAKIKSHKWLKKLGPEPLGNQFSSSYFYEKIRKRNSSIKAALMDQTLIAGLGNIYVLEALWLTKISPLRKANNISKSEVEELTNSIRRVLTLAIKAGGTSLQDFRQAGGEIGYFQRSLSVYGCSDEQCKNKDCLGIIQRVKQSGRTSYYCNSCQK